VLLGVRWQLHTGGQRVGVERRELARLRRIAPDPFDQIGEGLASPLGLLVLVLGGTTVHRLDLPRRKLRRFEPVEDAERSLAGDDDVDPAVVEALRNLGDACLAANPPRPGLGVVEDDSEGLSVLEAVGDHPLVALLEDVQREELARQENDGELEDRKLEAVVCHAGDCKNTDNGVVADANVDFEAEGLLEGLTEDGREARERLLRELHDQGVSLDELRTAVNDGRLALVPVERVLAGTGPRFTPEEVAERTGLERAFLDRQWRALGMALADEDEAVYTERDVDAASGVAAIREAGVPEEGILEISRLLGMSMSQLAAANRSVIAGAFVSDENDEYENAMRLAAAAEAFLPLAAESLKYALTLHLREQIRHDAFAGGPEGPRPDAAQEVTVCFADMVGFTQLGESLAPDELGAVTGRLNELATEVIEPPVRLVKLIGDAVMFAGPEPEAVLDAALELVERAAREGGEFPILRAGVACGEALARGGDWYGATVNLASRITGRARPGSVLADEELYEALAEDYDWTFAGEKRLKGLDAEVKVYRCRRLGTREDGDRASEPGLAETVLSGVAGVIGDGGEQKEEGDVKARRGSRRRRARRS
jgi:adenylate cyclase